MARVDTLKNFLSDIADKLREKLGTEETIAHAEYDTRIDEVYEAGGQSEYDRFWDSYQDNGSRRQYDYAFAGAGWNDETFKPKYPLIATNSQMMFRVNSVTKIPAVDFRDCDELQQTFSYAQNLVTIEKIILNDEGTNVFTSAFTYCTALRNIAFDGVIGASINLGRSAGLTTESVDNITEHLADLTGKAAQTLTLHATVGGNLTEEQINEIQNKNWNLVY